MTALYLSFGRKNQSIFTIVMRKENHKIKLMQYVKGQVLFAVLRHRLKSNFWSSNCHSLRKHPGDMFMS